MLCAGRPYTVLFIRLYVYIGLPLVLTGGSLVAVVLIPLYRKLMLKVASMLRGSQRTVDYESAIARAQRLMNLKDRCFRAVTVIMFGIVHRLWWCLCCGGPHAGFAL